nr:MAG TPA: hypothetical protein [Caudoviricetes sp.]
MKKSAISKEKLPLRALVCRPNTKKEPPRGSPHGKLIIPCCVSSVKLILWAMPRKETQ